MSERLKFNEEQKVRRRIRGHEGYRQFPYKDTVDVLTIGIGRNLEAKGLNPDEIELMFDNDFRDAEQAAASLDCWPGLNEVRRGVLVEMVFQMGLGGVLTFENFLSAAEDGDYEEAADEMLDSKWARQTPNRARRLLTLSGSVATPTEVRYERVVVPVVWQSDVPLAEDRVFWVGLPVRPGSLLCSASFSPQIKERPVRLLCVRRTPDGLAKYDTYRFPRAW
jgi:lysozyme